MTGRHEDGEVVYDSHRYKRHLRGWLSYAFASEVFVIVSLTLFLPICLEQFARDNGYLLPDKTVPCTTIPSGPPIERRDSLAEDEQRCVVKLGWLWIDSASFSLYVNSISVALQALTVVSMGNIADHPPHRKRLLLSFAFFGAIAATLFLLLPSSSPLWPVSALLGICANVGFGASIVAMNAYLPTLARHSEEVVNRRAELHEALLGTGAPRTSNGGSHVAESLDVHPEAEAQEPLLSSEPLSSSQDLHEGHASPEIESLKVAYATSLSRATSRISSQGIALGYAAGILLLLVALIPVTLLHGTTFALRLAIGLSGIWWALFSLPAALWLPSTTSENATPAELEWGAEDAESANSTKEWSASREIVNAWKRLGGMLRWREIKKLRNTFQYLAAWFLLSDGFTTITSTAILFAKTSLHMPASSLILIGIITPVSGIAGSLAWPYVQRRFAWTNLRVLVTLVCLASLVPAYGCLGFLSVFKEGKVKFGGLTAPGEIYVLAVYFGSVYGAFQGYARAFYSELIPRGEEARWYALFSITDKSSSFVGPLVVGIIADTTGNIRYAFFFLVFMVWLAVPVLLGIDVVRGRGDADRYKYRA
ncbi:autophagy-type protein 22 [Irpex rosettiformis]|uniref:Autophagy-type protein 22 n=1 Tax=Irpex rosettiformis TaxID=378272 RepID=A0ACB8TRT0_9APHY|nr:autophagy-type protein 22 [Irpex rosettiformis]